VSHSWPNTWKRLPSDSRKRSSTSYVSLRSSVNVVWHHVPYLSDQLQQVARMEPRERLKSSSLPALVVPATRRSSLGDRAFLVAASRLWNSLPSTLTAASTLHSFCRALKLIYSPHLSHHLSYIVCFLSKRNVYLTVRWPCSFLTLRHHNLFFFTLHYIRFADNGTNNVAPFRNESLFCHNLWNKCGQPHSDVVPDLTKRSRAVHITAIFD